MQDNLFYQYAQLVQDNFGIQLPLEKKALLESRLFKLINDNHAQPEFRDEVSFLEYIRTDMSGKALELLSEAITTHHTFFMREADHFSFFQNQVLPCVEKMAADGDVRTWCAACSSGEEAYTLAMILSDYFSLKGNKWETTLLATDLSKDILQVAKNGCYPLESIKSLPAQWRNSYFRYLQNDIYQVDENLRNRVLFRPFNLMTPVFPFKKPFHTIFCRNVMIYFDAPTREALVRRFYDFLEPGGFLFLGHSEVIDRSLVPFEYVMPSVYRKK